MASYGWGVDVTVVTGADLSGHQYQPATALGALADAPKDFFGVLQNKAKSGEHATTRVLGSTKFQVGSAVAAGDFVSITTSGYGYTVADSGSYAVGRALSAAASGGIANVWLFGAPVEIVA